MGCPMSRQAPQNNEEQLSTRVKGKFQSDAEVKAHLIFLSHSGHDKPFVTKLYEALRDADHAPFFDTHSLPAGEPFPEHIFLNASRCRLGVVVLSPNFLTSRWPMMELNSMYTSPSAPIILPLFFKISPNDVKRSSPRFSEWRKAWKSLAKKSPSRVDVYEWEDAIINLSKLNGVVHDSHTSENTFIQKSVDYISRIVHPLMRYMVSHVTGFKRLTHEVATLFEKMPSSSHFKAQAIGLYGVGGQGKTTICKIMINHFAGPYTGKCALIDFPYGDCQETHILNQFKKVLRQFTTITEHRLCRIDDLDQCLQLLKERMDDLNVFIALDNIWEQYLECAQRLVDVFKLSKGSKLLVTSRSRHVLISLLKDHKRVMPLPSVNREEAHQIFINSFARNHCGELDLEELDVDDVIECSQFKEQYHPLGIKALSVVMARTDRGGWPATRSEVREFFRGNDNIVAKAIRLNYDSIPEARRQLFLDVALIYIPFIQGRSSIYVLAKEDGGFKFDHLHTWLTALYKGTMTEPEIYRSVTQLAYDGLFELEISPAKSVYKVFVHDLYMDLAIQEGAASGKFLLDRENFEGTDINYEEAERMVLEGNGVLGGELPNLRLVDATNWDGNGLELMPHLQMLVVQTKYEDRIQRKVNLVSWRHTPHLAWLELGRVTCEDISGLSNLLVLKLRGCSINSCRQLNLNRLVNLRVLEIWGIAEVEEILGLDSLINLQILTLEYLSHLHKLESIQELTQLQVLEIEDCPTLEIDYGEDMVRSLCNLKALRCPGDMLLGGDGPLTFSKCIQTLCLTGHIWSGGGLSLRGMSALESLSLQFAGGWSLHHFDIGELPRLKRMVLAGHRFLFGDAHPGIHSHSRFRYSIHWMVSFLLSYSPQRDYHL